MAAAQPICLTYQLSGAEAESPLSKRKRGWPSPSRASACVAGSPRWRGSPGRALPAARRRATSAPWLKPHGRGVA